MITTWNDFDRFFGLHDMMRRFDRAMDSALSDATPFAGTLHETDEAYVLRADLPGVTKDTLELELHEGVLSLKATRRETTPEGFRAHRSERRDVAVARAFTLPGPVDAERAAASFDDGVLTVRIAKADAAGPRRIAVESV